MCGELKSRDDREAKCHLHKRFSCPRHPPPIPCSLWVRPQLLSHLSCLSHDCPCLVVLSHLSLPWLRPLLAWQLEHSPHLSSLLTLRTLLCMSGCPASCSKHPQNIQVRAWGAPVLREVVVRIHGWKEDRWMPVMGGLRVQEFISPIPPLGQGTALSWTPASLQSSWQPLNSSSPQWCPLAST